MKHLDPPIIVETIIQKSQEEVWRAITQRELMIQWFFSQIPDFKAEVGFRTRFDVRTPNRTFPDIWTILEVIPDTKIIYDWRYEGFKGVGKVTFEVISKNAGATVRLTSEVIEDFEEGIEEFKRESCEDGWNYFVKNRLANFLS